MPRDTPTPCKVHPHDAYNGLKNESTVSPRDEDEEEGEEEHALLCPFNERRGENEDKGWNRFDPARSVGVKEVDGCDVDG